MNVPSYMQASYLAALYGAAAMHLAALARDAIAGAYASEAFGEWRDADHDRLGQLALNIDETNAHRIAPTFVLPALCTPIDLLHRIHRMAAGGKRSPQQWAEFFQLDPALRAMLASGGPWHEGMPRDAAQRHQALSDALPHFDVEEALGDRFRPVSRQLRTELVETLLAARGP
jgi:hypothetical protein